MTTVHLDQVSKQIGQHCILKSINCKIDDGEFLVIVGPSGCGKSTLLRLIAGLDEVSAGEIRLNDTCINRISPSQRDIAMVFQQYALYPHMSVFKNMAYGLALRKLPKEEIRLRVARAANLLQLTDYLDRKPDALSGGQKQRVAMGRAIVRQPAVFLFDEPLSNLDTHLRTDMRHEIKQLHKLLNTTCIYVTHDQTEAMTMATRVMVLNQGRVEQIDTPQQLYQNPASTFVASFIGFHPMNFIPCHFEGVKKRLAEKCEDKLQSQEDILVGIRPENLSLTDRAESNSIPVNLDAIDNLGADKIYHLSSICGEYRFCARVFNELTIASDRLAIDSRFVTATIFDKNTGLRIGGF